MSRLRIFQLALLTWAVVSFFSAPLPSGVGGWPRAVNAVIFMTLGPACALGALLVRAVPPAIAGVIAVAASLTVLALSSQMLLIMGIWAPWRVAWLVALTTVALVGYSLRMWTEDA